MSPLIKRRIYLSLAAVFSLLFTLFLSFALAFNFKILVLESLLWITGFTIAVITFAIGVLFSRDALNCGREKKHLRF